MKDNSQNVPSSISSAASFMMSRQVFKTKCGPRVGVTSQRSPVPPPLPAVSYV